MLIQSAPEILDVWRRRRVGLAVSHLDGRTFPVGKILTNLAQLAG